MLELKILNGKIPMVLIPMRKYRLSFEKLWR